MYNEEIKLRYIEEKESTTNMPAGYLTRQFNKAESFEERLGKDISSFTVYEIEDFYKTLNMTSVESLTVLNSHLSLYTQWCLQQNLVPDCQNHFAEMVSSSLVEYINTFALKKSIITRETLYEWIEELVNPSDKFIMLALFEGIEGENYCELFSLKMSDFDGNKVKLCTGRELTVSSKLIALAEEANETLRYYTIASNGERSFPLLDEDIIIKNYPNCKSDEPYQKGKRIYGRVKRNFESIGIDKYMKPRSLFDSGKIDYINTRSKELEISAKEFIYTPEYAEEVKYRFGYDLQRLRVSFIKKYGDYLV